MITDQDIDKMKEVLATKAEFQDTVAALVTKAEFKNTVDTLATKTELQEAVAQLATKEDIRGLQTLVEKSITKTDAYFQEMTMLGHQVDTHTKHIDQIAHKLDLKLEY